MSPAILARADWAGLDPDGRRAALARPAVVERRDRASVVSDILAAVRRGGDEAVLDWTERLDGVRPASLEAGPEDLERAWAAVGPGLRGALETAARRIERFHALQRPREVRLDTGDGTLLRRKPVALGAVGLYAPAGTAPLPSSVLMTAIPARLAGCPVRVLAAPPGPDGEIAAPILAAARLCGVGRVFRMGGAQAVAALAYGTRTVPKADKIFGPGNAWVAEAKRQAAQDPEGAASDLPAGPSEVMVVVDEGSDPAYAAADLLSQAEHGSDSQATLVSLGSDAADRVDRELICQLGDLPRRKIALEALSKSRALVVSGEDEALEVVEAYAPEHLVVLLREARPFAERVRRAGAVFVGPYSPEAAGDYASGANHVLPTFGAARAYSGLGVGDFMRWVTIQESTREGLEAMAGAIDALAACEGLEAHRRAVALRCRAAGVPR